jgi:pSer/pThr/pTyr-binding forkhead associated (FHA) protein
VVAPPSPKEIALAHGLDDIDEDDGRTRGLPGARLRGMKNPSKVITLQILDEDGEWQTWTTVRPSGLKVGRSEKNAHSPNFNTISSHHMRIALADSKLIVENLDSLNGVYVKLSAPVELEDGRRFRVGSHVIEFRSAEPPAPIEPKVAEDGEQFWSRDLAPLAYLDLIRPDGKPGLRYPITKEEPTILGREPRAGRPVDLALSGDEWVSGQHAQIRPRSGRFFLEDLKSRNGTFIEILGPTAVALGEILLLGKVQFQIVEESARPG